MREEYPDATYEVCKRAILFEFHEPLGDEQDPSVDLIVALTRVEGDGRWIPNTEAECWDASDPEEHTRLLNDVDLASRTPCEGDPAGEGRRQAGRDAGGQLLQPGGAGARPRGGGLHDRREPA